MTLRNKCCLWTITLKPSTHYNCLSLFNNLISWSSHAIAFMISFPFIVSNYTWANYSHDLGKANMHEVPAMHSDEWGKILVEQPYK